MLRLAERAVDFRLVECREAADLSRLGAGAGVPNLWLFDFCEIGECCNRPSNSPSVGRKSGLSW